MIKKTNRIVLINFIGSFVLQTIAFITTPIFSRLLSTFQFGMYSLFMSWESLLLCIMGLGMNAAIGSGMYTYKENYLSFRNSTLLSSTIISIIEILPIIIFNKFISELIGCPSKVVVIISITALSHYIITFSQMCFIYEKKAEKNLILSILISILNVLLSLLFVCRMDENTKYLGRIYGMSITYIAFAAIIWLLFFLKKPIRIEKKYLKYSIAVGFPIVFHSLSQQILGQSDRVMMQMFGISTAEIGIYSLFYTINSVLSSILGALNNSWCPFYYDDVSEEKWDILDIKCRNYIELFTVLGVGFLLLSREVSYLMADESYWSGINVIPILSFAVYFTFMYQFPVNFELFHKKTKFVAIGTVGAGTLNIILNAIMIPMWGMYGAAIATALSYLALFFAHYFIVTHMKEYPYHLKMTVFIPGVIGMLVGAVLFYALSPWWYVRWGLGLVLGCFELYRIYKRRSIF